MIDLRNYVCTHFGGPDDFDDPKKEFVWNWPTWQRLILRIAASMKVDQAANEIDADLETFSLRLVLTSPSVAALCLVFLTGVLEPDLDLAPCGGAITKDSTTLGPLWTLSGEKLFLGSSEP